MSNATLSIIGNVVQYNSFVGQNTALFYLNGGTAHIFDNNFSYNGFLTEASYAGNPNSLFLLSDNLTPLPYAQYVFDLA